MKKILEAFSSSSPALFHIWFKYLSTTLKSSDAEYTKYQNYKLFFVRFTIKLDESEEGYTAQCLEIPAAISEGNTKEEALFYPFKPQL